MDRDFTLWVMCDSCQRAFTSATSLVAHKINSHVYPKKRVTWKKGTCVQTRTRAAAVVPELRRKSSRTTRNPMKTFKILQTINDDSSSKGLKSCFENHLVDKSLPKTVSNVQVQNSNATTEDSANKCSTTKGSRLIKKVLVTDIAKNKQQNLADITVKVTNLMTEESAIDEQPLVIDDFEQMIEVVTVCHLPEENSVVKNDTLADSEAKEKTEKISSSLSLNNVIEDRSVLPEIICESKLIVTKGLHSNVHADQSPPLKCEAPQYKDFVYVRNEVNSIHELELEAPAIRSSRLSSSVVGCPICSVKLSSSHALLVHLAKCLNCPSCKAQLTASSIYNSKSEHFENSPECYPVKCQTCQQLYYSYHSLRGHALIHAYDLKAFPLFTAATENVM